MDPDALKLLAYRMEAVAIGHLAIRYTMNWDEVPAIKVFFGEDQVIEGKATAFTNSAIESAIIHCRVLLSFLGLVAQSKDTLSQRGGHRADDVVIETIFPSNERLKKVTPEEAVSVYAGPQNEAEQALAYVLHTANKALAHATSGFVKSDNASPLIEIAFRGTLALMEAFFYRPVCIEVPKYELSGRQRSTNNSRSAMLAPKNLASALRIFAIADCYARFAP